MQIITSFSLLFRFKLVLTRPLSSFVSTHYVNLVGKLMSPCLSFPVLEMARIIRFSFNVFGAYGWKACYLIIGPIVCAQFLWPCNGNTHDWETCASHVCLGSTRAVVLACPAGLWPTTLQIYLALASRPLQRVRVVRREWKLTGEKACFEPE